MKKILSVTLTVLLLLSSISLTAFAAEEPSAEVCVTVVDENGTLAVANRSFTVTDTDSDGALTVSDALYAAHEKEYEGGAAAGYGAYAHDTYVLSLSKLWGTENGGSYGYCINNISAWSLADPVKDGDHVYAYVYTAESGTYSFFDKTAVSVAAGEDIILTLSANGYDADYNTVVEPVEGAVITVNGEQTEYKTDASGKVTITLTEGGSFVISAVSDTLPLTPPVCLLSVSAEQEKSESSVSSSEASSDNSLGKGGAILLCAAVLLLLLCGIAVLRKRRIYENKA